MVTGFGKIYGYKYVLHNKSFAQKYYPHTSKKMIFIIFRVNTPFAKLFDILNDAGNPLTAPYTGAYHAVFFVQALHIL